MIGASVVDLGRLLGRSKVASVEITEQCLERIADVDPLVGAVLALDPTALDQAARSDRRRAGDGALGPLDGIPVLVKDNVDTAGLSSTAGSRLLATTPPRRDAEVVSRLRAAGAVVLGKTNLSEWANFRSAHSVEGWSAVGGQTRNPHRAGHSPWGSSSGSAAAVAVGMAPLALGTETDGSIVGPAGVNGVAGLKPETGLLPLDGIVPVSRHQDTVGPLATTLADAVVCLEVLTGRSYGTAELAGTRLGVWRPAGMPDASLELFDAVCDALRAAGATTVPLDVVVPRELAFGGTLGLYGDFRPSLEGYLRARGGVPATLEALIDANARDPIELSLFGQDLFEEVAAMSADDRDMAQEAGRNAREQARRLLDTTLAQHRVGAVLAPSNAPAWPIDGGDPRPVATSSTPAALAGYPNTSVPAGFTDGLPVGVSVFGPSTVVELLPIALAVEREILARHHLNF